MKKIVITLLVISTSGYSQVGIGNTNPQSTVDITAVNTTGTSTNIDGLLIPRVDRQRAQSMLSIPESTLIYVNSIATGTATGIASNITSVGFYFFNTTTSKWVKLNAAAGGSNWSLSGNSGTTAGTNFLGTTDTQDLVLKTNSNENLRILNTNGHVLVNTTINDVDNGSNNIFEVLASTAGDDAVNGYASGSGSGVHGESVGDGNSTSSPAAGVKGLINQTATGNENAAGVMGINANITRGSGYASPLKSSSFSAISGVTGLTASKLTNENTDAYMFGVVGEILRDTSVSGSDIPRRSGGVLGDVQLLWGALGYKAANANTYCVYGGGGTNNGNIQTTNTGRTLNVAAELTPNSSIGLGINGGVMGGYVKGNQYGLIAKGEEFGMYIDGNAISNKPIVMLEKGNSQRTISYASTSTSVDITTRGKSKLINGETFVRFDEAFKNSIDLDARNFEDDLNITITANGNTNGVYVKSITKEGFYVQENQNGVSNVSFNWVVIGTRKGYKDGVKISNTLIDNNFDKNINGVMVDDGDENASAKPIYFDGKNVEFKEIPAELLKSTSGYSPLK